MYSPSVQCLRRRIREQLVDENPAVHPQRAFDDERPIDDVGDDRKARQKVRLVEDRADADAFEDARPPNRITEVFRTDTCR